MSESGQKPPESPKFERNPQYAGPDKCRSITLNLLHLLTKDSGSVTADAFVRELSQTERCFAQYPQLEPLVKDYEDFISRDAYDRLKNFKQTREDELKCAAALIHYKSWSEEQLRSCLPPHLQLWEVCTHNAHTALATVGLLTSGYWGIKGTNAILRRSFERLRDGRGGKKIQNP